MAKRLRYFNGQFLKEPDFTEEQTYLLDLHRDHARNMHTAGLVGTTLSIEDPPPNSKTVTISPGVAYDDLGNRIVLLTPVDPQLQGYTPLNASLTITISYHDEPSDKVSDTGVSDFTRFTEVPIIKVYVGPSTGSPTRELVLATVARNDTGVITSIDRSKRLIAGVRTGDLQLNTLTVTGPATLENVVVHGRVDGRKVSDDGSKLDAHVAITAGNPHGTRAADVGALPNTGGAISGNLSLTGNLNGARARLEAGDGDACLMATVTNTGGTIANAVVARASNSGAASVVALDTRATGTGNGIKVGIQSATESDSRSTAGLFDAKSVTTANTQPVRGLEVSATGMGSGAVTGILVTVTGTGTGAKTGLNVTATTGGGTLTAATFNGSVAVNGSLTKTSGTFLIDHPLDPLNKTLAHSFVESPEELCLYRGTTTLDAKGHGFVEMPSYFPALTKEEDATVTLTATGRKPFLVSYEWNGKHTGFKVYGEPERSVSYLVLACRDDPAMAVLRRPVEATKNEEDKNHLLFPDAYPDLVERGIRRQGSMDEDPYPSGTGGTSTG